MNSFALLVFIFILKIIILVVLPIFILFFYKGNNKKLIIIDCSLVFILIVLRLFGFSIVTDSSIGRLKEIYREKIYKNENSSIIDLDSNFDVYLTDKFYKTKTGSSVYYFNNNTYPLNNYKFSCSGDLKYLKNYGTGVTALSMVVSTVINKNVDPIELIKLAKKNDIINCNSGINMDSLLRVVDNTYNLHHYSINSTEMDNYVKNGGVVLAKVKYNSSVDRNMFCNHGYVVIYSVDNNNSYFILNPNINGNDIICPDNTDGAFSLLKDNDNDDPWSIGELNLLVESYYYLERN